MSDTTTTPPRRAIATRVADKSCPADRAAILDGARAFARSTELLDILPPIEGPAFERDVFRVLDLPQTVVFLAEDAGGDVIGGIGVFAVPYTWNTDLMSAQELFWWVRPGSDPRAATMLLRVAVDSAKAAGVSVLAFSKLETSPAAVDTVYRRMGLRPAQTNYVGLLT